MKKQSKKQVELEKEQNRKSALAYYNSLTEVFFSILYMLFAALWGFHAIWHIVANQIEVDNYKRAVLYGYAEGRTAPIHLFTLSIKQIYTEIVNHINSLPLSINLVSLLVLIILFIVISYGCYENNCRSENKLFSQFNFTFGTVLFLAIFIIKLILKIGISTYNIICKVCEWLSNCSVTFIPWIVGTVFIILSIGIVIFIHILKKKDADLKEE